MRCGKLFLISLAGALALSASSVRAQQDWPNKPIRVITNVGVGGTYDIFVRALGEQLFKTWGRAIVVEPRPGGNWMIAGRTCAAAAPDGYTICALSGETLVYPEALFKTVVFDAKSDLKPITNLFFNTQLLVARADTNIRSFADMAGVVKANPGKMAFIAPGIPHRLFFENFNRAVGADLVDVPFRGGGEALSNIVTGMVQFTFFGAANFLSYVQDGSLIALAVDGERRSPLYPDTPTLAEIGYTGKMTRNYLGLVAPAKTPDAIVQRIRADVTAAMNEAQFRKRQLIDRGLEPIGDSPGDFAAFLERDRILAREVVRDAGVEQQ